MKKRTIILTVLTLTGLLLAGCASSTAQVKRLDMEAAKKAAIEHAGFTSEEVSFRSVELDQRNGIEYYDVEFTADGKKYDYDIDALTGAVIDSEAPEASKEKTQKEEISTLVLPNAASDQSTAEQNISNTELSKADAKRIALEQVPGATEADIREFEVDYDDGRLEYEGSIWYDELEYEFEIDGYSGAIRSWEVESIYD